MRRLLALAGALALLLAAAPPVAAQAGASARVGGVTHGSVVRDYVRIIGSGSSSVGIRRLEILINGTNVRNQDLEGVNTNPSIDYTWATDRAAPVGGRNASYTIKVLAYPNGGGGAAAAEVKVVVDNPASTPRGVTADHNGNEVIVSWAANPEPDLTGYRVERDSGGGWSTIGTPGGTSISDAPGPGSHSYRVIAFRYSAINGSNASAPSGAASATVPAPSSNEADGSGSNGGSGSGAGSGSGEGKDRSGSSSGGGKEDASGGGKGSGSRGGSRPGSGGGAGSFYGAFGSAGGRRLSPLGLPGRLSLPGRAGVGRAEVESIQNNPGWGEFSEELPYNIPEGQMELEEVVGPPRRTAALSPYRIIPPDGLRWVAAGLWLIVTAALIKLLERRIAQDEAAGTTGTEEVIAEPQGSPARAAGPAAARGSATDPAPTLERTAPSARSRRTSTVNATAKKTSAAARSAAKTGSVKKKSASAASTSARTAKSPTRKTSTRKTTTARKSSARRSSARKTTAKARLELVKDDSAAA